MSNKMDLRNMSFVVALLSWAVSAAADSFVLEPSSMSLTTIPAACEDILNDPSTAGFPPSVGLNLSDLGLNPGDCIDALSDGNDAIHVPTHGDHDHLFSVTWDSVGLPGTAVAAEWAGDTAPPGGPDGHAADLFLWNHSASGTNTLAPPGFGWTAGTTDGDEANAALVIPVPPDPGDDVNGYEATTLASVGTPPFEVYFSLVPGSITLGILGATPGDILAVGGVFGPTPVIFLTAATMGIQQTVDMDALALEVQPPPPGGWPTLLIAQFSVSRATATGWADGFGNAVNSGAHILVYDPAVVPAAVIGHGPLDLGLDLNDDVNALESAFVPSPPGCQSDAECNDGIPCTIDACIGNECFNDPLPDCCTCDAQCDDGNQCTEDRCCDGVCDNAPLPTGFPCGDGNLCTINDACTQGLCAGTLVDCSYLDDDCNAGVCNQQTGACEPAPDNEGGGCEDGLYCTDGDFCLGGSCVSGPPRGCDDLDACTDDACDEDTQRCIHALNQNCCDQDADCDDGLYCNGLEICSSGQDGICLPGTPPNCDDLDPCTNDYCDEENAACRYEQIEGCCATAEDCDDGNECTQNVCGPLNTCEYPPAQAGIPCGNQSITECSASDACNAQGICEPNHADDGTPCDDDDACTDADTCLAGVCTGTPNGLCETCQQGGVPGDPTSEISFQAKLKNADGQLLQGDFDLEFRFYADENGANPVGDPIPQMVNIPVDAAGVVSTTIPITETIFDGSARWLGVTVSPAGQQGSELTPLIPVNSAAQAFRTQCVAGEDVVDHLDLGGPETTGALRIFGPEGSGRSGHAACVELTTDLHEGLGVGSYCGREILRNYDGHPTVELEACNVFETMGMEWPLGGSLRLYTPDYHETVELQAGSVWAGSSVTLRDYTGTERLTLWGGSGSMYLRSTSDKPQTWLGGGRLMLYQDLANVGVDLKADNAGKGGEIIVRNSSNKEAVVVNADHGSGGTIRLNDNNGATRLILEGDHRVSTGDNTGAIRVYNRIGVETVTIVGDYKDSRDGRVITQELEITGGSDLSEQFDIDGSVGEVKPGMVVSIDPRHPGKLEISSQAYDYRVAGVISGAGGVKPGMLMGQAGSVADGDHAVALTGRVYCWADASNGPIEPGDLLTTSDTPGHAMKVTDRAKAPGAVIGKAMTSLDQGTGLILVLVNLQ